MRYEKGEKSSAKGGLEHGSIASKSMHHTTETDAEIAFSFVLLNNPITR